MPEGRSSLVDAPRHPARPTGAASCASSRARYLARKRGKTQGRRRQAAVRRKERTWPNLERNPSQPSWCLSGEILLGTFLIVVGALLVYCLFVLWPAVHEATVSNGPASTSTTGAGTMDKLESISFFGVSYSPTRMWRFFSWSPCSAHWEATSTPPRRSSTSPATASWSLAGSGGIPSASSSESPWRRSSTSQSGLGSSGPTRRRNSSIPTALRPLPASSVSSPNKRRTNYEKFSRIFFDGAWVRGRNAG